MTDTLDKIIDDRVESLMTDMRMCLPGRIEKYDPDTHIANVQPLLKMKFYRRKAAQDLPIVNRVPIIHPRTKTAVIRLPVSVGDIVTLVFADRSLENWLGGDGAIKDPMDTRMHHLSDAYAILGGYPEGKPITANNKDALEIVVEPGTKVTIGNGTDELLQLAHDSFTKLKELATELGNTLTEIKLITVTGNLGSPTSTPLNAAQFTLLKSTVDAISTDVQTAITSLENIKV